jgi:hypothetical protein
MGQWPAMQKDLLCLNVVENKVLLEGEEQVAR